MTSQIVIKLNEKKFKPILESVGSCTAFKSYSELAGFCIWFCYLSHVEQVSGLGNKTRFEYISEKMGISIEEGKLKSIQMYSAFLNNKKH